MFATQWCGGLAFARPGAAVEEQVYPCGHLKSLFSRLEFLEADPPAKLELPRWTPDESQGGGKPACRLLFSLTLI